MTKVEVSASFFTIILELVRSRISKTEVTIKHNTVCNCVLWRFCFEIRCTIKSLQRKKAWNWSGFGTSLDHIIWWRH